METTATLTKETARAREAPPAPKKTGKLEAPSPADRGAATHRKAAEV